MKTLLIFVLAVVLVATPTLSYAYAEGLGLAAGMVVGVGYLLYLGIAEIVKAAKSSGVGEEGTKAATESGPAEQVRPEPSTPKSFDRRCNVLPHTANCW